LQNVFGGPRRCPVCPPCDVHCPSWPVSVSCTAPVSEAASGGVLESGPFEVRVGLDTCVLLAVVFFIGLASGRVALRVRLPRTGPAVLPDLRIAPRRLDLPLDDLAEDERRNGAIILEGRRGPAEEVECRAARGSPLRW